MTTDVRPIEESELADWLRAVHVGFLTPPAVTDDDVAQLAEYSAGHRLQGAFDKETGRCVGTFRSFPQKLTVPGGAEVVANAISNVTVSPTHRRRGLLSRMMSGDLAAAKERGDAVATLIAAEYPIYGRFGFGAAAATTEWEIDVARTGLDRRWARPEDGGRIDLVTAAEARDVGPVIHERLRAGVHGAIDRSARWWNVATGTQRMSHYQWTEPYYAVYRSADGRPEGLLIYRADDHWTDAQIPLNTARVRDLVAVTPAAERALWHYLCSVDWVLKVRTGKRAPDDLVPHLLPDARAAQVVTHCDHLWVRLLDVARALRARTYEVPASLVLEVEDPDGLSGGRYRLEASRLRAECAPTTDAPDLTLGVAELSALYLGGESAVRLAALGRISEASAGVAETVDAVFRTARKPWCPDIF
ncbi:GNAT family N-acetyltransferase [Streptomyces sp. NPDC059176]|uniref:GNAT family N-acetyltransferase n=1 Tax=unclassified Streptomyces TaxID=2593676 RepID=UPI0036AA8A65